MTRVIIRAVPWNIERAANARALKRATGGRIVWDTTHDAYDTFLAALRFAAPGPAIHLEDDILLTSDWGRKVQEVIASHADEVVQFFSRRQADLTVGSRHCPGRDFLWATCFYVPGRLCQPMIDYCAHWEGRRPPPTTELDTSIGAFLADAREDYWLHVPSLVQHRRWKSVVRPGRSTHRQSATFVP